MRLNSQARTFSFAISIILFILVIESVPHSIHHIGESEKERSEKPCLFLLYWLQGSSSVTSIPSISLLTNNYIVEYLPIDENHSIGFYGDSSLLIRSPPILGQS